MANIWLKRTVSAVAVALLAGTAAAVPATAADSFITWSGSITAGASYTFGQVPQAPTCSVESFPEATCVVSGYDTAVGTHTLTATAVSTDMVFVDTISYTVTAWTLKGFYRPVKMGEGVWNTVKAGSTVPLKFKIYQGDSKLKTAAAVTGFTLQSLDCSTGAALADATVLNSKLKYRSGLYRLNWKTPKSKKSSSSQLAAASKAKKSPSKSTAKACYLVTMTSADGSTLAANFRLR